MSQTSLKIGVVARRASVAVDTVRYYERVGLIPEPPRLASGYRAYPPDTPRRLRFIRGAQELGFTLGEIRELLELRVRDEASCADVRAAAQRKIEDIDTRMQRLASMRTVLGRLARACPGDGPTADCPILEALDEQADAGGKAPENGETR